MHLCPTVLLALSFTLTLILFDLGYKQFDILVPHIVLGSIITVLFFGICKMGYENLNWVFIAILTLAILSGWMINIAYKDQSDALAIYNRQQCNILNTGGVNPPPPTDTDGGSGTCSGTNTKPNNDTMQYCEPTVCTYV